MNTLYYGDNLKILRDYIKDESVDLIYLDPPFNSNRNYNVLFRNESGSDSESQITAFEDTWHWHTGGTAATYNELINEPDQVGRMIESFYQFIGTNQMMAYLVMMAARLKELHRVLKPTGSLYLHCDPTASHYLKIVLDTIFGVDRFSNEIAWVRSLPHGNMSKKYGASHDVLFFYRKSDDTTWNGSFMPHRAEYLKEFYKHKEPDGRVYRLISCINPNPDRPNLTYEWNGVTKVWKYTKERMQRMHDEGLLVYSKGGTPSYKGYLDQMKGSPTQDVWSDIPPLMGGAQERLGYPTQKPVALLERIIKASSNEGDIVLDPFCGCGTTIAAAQKLNREWIGIDVTHLAVGLQKLRLKDSFGMLPGTDYKVVGQPEDLGGAKELAEKDKYGFQWWILPLIGAKAFGSEAGQKEGKKGADKGIDGMMVFTDDNSGKAKKVIVSVKGGHNVNVSHIRDLGHVIERENAAIGVYLTLEPPTKPMLTEAAEKGFYHSPGWNKDYPRLQILTVEEILNGKTVSVPPNMTTFKQAEKVLPNDSDQGALSFE